METYVIFGTHDERARFEYIAKEIAPKYEGRAGGYTRIIKLGARSGSGDASPMAMIEFI